MRPFEIRPSHVPMYPLVFLATPVAAWVALRYTPMRALLSDHCPISIRLNPR